MLHGKEFGLAQRDFWKEINPLIWMNEFDLNESIFIARSDAEAPILGCLIQRVDSLEKTLMLGRTDSIDVSLSKLWEIVKDRKAWSAAVHGVAKSQTRLNNWITTKEKPDLCPWLPESNLCLEVELVVKKLPATAGDVRNACSVPEFGRSPGEGDGSPLQHSCLENPMDRGAWQATIHRVAKSRTRLKQCRMYGPDKRIFV